MMYEQFLNCSEEEFSGQFFRWKASWRNQEGPLPSAVLTTLSKCNRSFFPLIHVLLRIYATLPVHTAEVERGFSSMRRVKTFLRSTMSGERFTGLSHISINRDIEIPNNEIVQKFVQKKRRSDFNI